MKRCPLIVTAWRSSPSKEAGGAPKKRRPRGVRTPARRNCRAVISRAPFGYLCRGRLLASWYASCSLKGLARPPSARRCRGQQHRPCALQERTRRYRQGTEPHRRGICSAATPASHKKANFYTVLQASAGTWLDE